MKKWLLALGVCLIFISWRYYKFQRAKAALPERSELIQQEVDRKLEQYRKKVTEKCHARALEEAIEIADSIAFAKAHALFFFDSLSRPEKPVKPEKPASMPLKDSVEVKPLLDSLSSGN